MYFTTDYSLASNHWMWRNVYHRDHRRLIYTY